MLKDRRAPLHGAELDRPGGETWRGDVPLRTAYQHALLRNRTDEARLLADLGASTAVAPADEAVAAVARGERPESPLPDELDPDPQEVLILAALRGQLDAVIAAVGADFAGVVGGSPKGSLVQQAAWIGDAGLVTRLLTLGADPNPPAQTGTPLAWAAHGSAAYALPGRDYVAVAEAISRAGNEIDLELVQVA
jgi:hypothetical protein